jgi:uncharacterized protein involved in cysteine biosynthesis
MMKELLRGAAYVPRGFLTILTRPRLWAVSAIPLLLNIIIFVLTVGLTIYVLNDWLIKETAPGALEQWKGFWWGALAIIIEVLGWLGRVASWIIIPLLTAWLMGAFPFSIILRAIFTPFATIVGERTEQVILDLPQAKEPFHLGELGSSITMAIVNTILLAFAQGLLYVILVPLALIPPLWMIVPPAIMAGMDHTDPTYCRKNYYMRERVALWRARKWRFLGFGVTFFFLLGIPFVNAIIFPTVACGAALLYLELDRK